jgi:hypothetical protein
MQFHDHCAHRAVQIPCKAYTASLSFSLRIDRFYLSQQQALLAFIIVSGFARLWHIAMELTIQAESNKLSTAGLHGE